MKNSNLLSRDEMKSLIGGQSAMGACYGQTERGVTCSGNTMDCQKAVCVVGGAPSGLTVGVCCDGVVQWGMIDFICFEATCVEYV